MQIPVQILSNNKTILGVLHVPEKRAEGSPVIILCYGLNGDRVENHRMSTIASRLAEKMGIVFFRFDYIGHGLSEGEFWDASLDTKSEDAFAVMDFVKGCFQDEECTFTLLGFSDGARIVNKIAESYDDIKGVCIWNPIFSSMTKSFPSSNKNRLTREPMTKKMVFPLFGLWLGCKYLSQVNQNFTVDDFFKLKMHKLLIFGGSDNYTTETRKNIQKIENKEILNLEVEVIKGARHLFNHSIWADEVIYKTLNWVLQIGKINSDKKLEAERCKN